MNAPPCASPAPIGGGGACDALELPVLSSFKTAPVIPRYRNLGMPQRRGRSPKSVRIVRKISHENRILKRQNNGGWDPHTPGCDECPPPRRTLRGEAKYRERLEFCKGVPMIIVSFRNRWWGLRPPYPRLWCVPPPPTGRPRGGLHQRFIRDSRNLPRHAPEGPWGEEPS